MKVLYVDQGRLLLDVRTALQCVVFHTNFLFWWCVESIITFSSLSVLLTFALNAKQFGAVFFKILFCFNTATNIFEKYSSVSLFYF